MWQTKCHTNSTRFSILTSFLLKAYRLPTSNLSDTNSKFRTVTVFVTLNLQVILSRGKVFCSTMQSNANRQWYLNKIWIWSIGGTILTGESKILGEKPVPVTRCLPKVPYGQGWLRAQALALVDRTLNAWGMACIACRYVSTVSQCCWFCS
jgi:hypothetical protein